MLLHEVVEFAAVRTPDAVALIFDDRSWTFAELWAEIQATAAWLAGRTAVGDRIAIVSDNRPEVVVLMYAAPMVGVIAMFANTRLVDSEIDDLIADVTPVLVLRTPELDALPRRPFVGAPERPLGALERSKVATDERATA